MIMYPIYKNTLMSESAGIQEACVICDPEKDVEIEWFY